MKLKKASAWYYNKGKTHVNINELDIIIKKGDIVDLFKLNPRLSWNKYIESATTGVLFHKRDKLIHLPHPPNEKPSPYTPFVVSKEHKTNNVPARHKSGLVAGKDSEDYLAAIESEFPPSAQPLGQEEMWNTERDKYLKTLYQVEQGEDGEVFSDNLFEEEYLSDVPE